MSVCLFWGEVKKCYEALSSITGGAGRDTLNTSTVYTIQNSECTGSTQVKS